MHQPGIEPGASAWQADILPLNHWYSLLHCEYLTNIIHNNTLSFEQLFLFCIYLCRGDRKSKLYYHKIRQTHLIKKTHLFINYGISAG